MGQKNKILILLLVTALMLGTMPLAAYGTFVFDDEIDSASSTGIALADEDAFKITISFDASEIGIIEDGLSQKTIKIWSNQKIDSSQIPVVQLKPEYQGQYAFDGWYIDENTEFDTSMTFKANTTIYARWI